MRRDTDTFARQAGLVLWGAIAAGVVVRLLVFRGQGFPSDVGTFMAWAERLAQLGPGGFYEPGYFSDYPPGFLYVLWIVGALFDGEALRLVVKALSVPADIAIAVLLARIVRPSAGPMAGALAGAIWILQPGAIFAGPYWGQVDAWGTLPFLGALVAAGRGRWGLAGALAAVAGMVKPQFGLVAVVLAFAAAFELIQRSRWRPIVALVASGLATAILIAIPFGLTPGAFVQLVRDAAGTYPFTSLYAFNVWSIVGDFWKPDPQYVVPGAILLAAGTVAAVVPLWWRRDVAALLAVGACAAMAFYFLPTRAHERYIFPAFALLVPFAATRSRMLVPYLLLSAGFFVSLYFAFTRYPQNGVVAPPLLESTLFARNGQIALALLMLGVAALIAWRLARGEARLTPTLDLGAAVPAPAPTDLAAGAAITSAGPSWRLPAGLWPGRAPTRRDVALALLVALAVIATRGFRLDHPRDMYFDEVYHARTAFELLAQREPYEWTHPHLAKEIMALGIAAFGGDRVEGTEGAPDAITAFAVSNDGLRAYGHADGRVDLAAPTWWRPVPAPTPSLFGGFVGGSGRTSSFDGPVRALAFAGTSLFALTDRSIWELSLPDLGARYPPRPIGAEPTSSFAVSQGRPVVGTTRSVSIHDMGTDRPPVVVPIPAVAITAKPDSNEVFIADPTGAIHIVDANTGRETTRPIAGGPPLSAIAYARGPDRIFGVRAGEAAIDWYEPPRVDAGAQRDGSHGGSVALRNARTGDVGPARALALVPRSQFLYALTDRAVVVIEPHGVSPFASIPVTGTMLGVDGTADELLVAGLGTTERIPTGRHAFAWRVPGVAAAAVLAFFLVLLARRLFASRLAPAIVGAAVLLDGAMFAQARIGMNDIYVGTFIVAGWYFVVAAHAPRRSALADLVLAGICFGLALASKWVAAYALGGLALATIGVTAAAWARGRPGSGGPFDLFAGPPIGALERSAERVGALPGAAVRALGRVGPRAALLLACFAVIPAAIYLAGYVRWFGGATIPFGWDLGELTKQMYWYHSGLTAPHPAGSPWWSWPLVLKPVYWYLGQPGPDQTAVIYAAGNIVVFWGGLIALGWAAVAAVRARSVTLGFLIFAMLTQYVAWIPITRVLFFYHFFTALPFYLLILAAALVALWETGRRDLVAGGLALATAAFVFFYPFISGLPVPGDQAAVFYVLPTWQYDCQFYPDFRCAARVPAELPLQAAAGRLLIAAGTALVALALMRVVFRDGSRQRLRAWAERLAPRRTPAS